MMSRYYFKTEEKITKQKQGYVEVEDNYTQIYDNVLSLTLKLNSLLDIQILLYLSKNCNQQNVFNANSLMHQRIQRELDKTFTERTFYNSLKTLSDAKLIVKLTKGQYQINPFTVWRESQKDRSEIINAILEGKEHDSYKILSESTTVEEPTTTYRLQQ